jgi:hypothetical protein
VKTGASHGRCPAWYTHGFTSRKPGAGTRSSPGLAPALLTFDTRRLFGYDGRHRILVERVEPADEHGNFSYPTRRHSPTISPGATVNENCERATRWAVALGEPIDLDAGVISIRPNGLALITYHRCDMKTHRVEALHSKRFGRGSPSPSASGVHPTVHEIVFSRGFDLRGLGLLDHASLGRGFRRLSGDGA